MNETLIARWNERVKDDDIVWVLGDFAMGRDDPAIYFNRLRGRKRLVFGNHDGPKVFRLPWEVKVPFTEIKLNGHNITLCHYAMRVWNKAHRGALQLFGHSHGGMPGNSQSLDVGVDCWNFYPITLDEIVARMVNMPAYRAEDYHGSDNSL